MEHEAAKNVAAMQVARVVGSGGLITEYSTPTNGVAADIGSLGEAQQLVDKELDALALALDKLAVRTQHVRDQRIDPPVDADLGVNPAGSPLTEWAHAVRARLLAQREQVERLTAQITY